MKKIISVLGLMMALSPAAQALELRVAPLALEAQAEVLGLRLEVDGKAAIVFAGKAAKTVADAAGVAIDTSVETLVATGDDVEQLVLGTLKDTAVVGKTVIVTGKHFAENSLELVLGDITAGKDLFIDTTRDLTRVTKAVTKTLVKATKNSVTFVFDSGDRVIQFSGKILGTVRKGVFALLGWILPF